MYELEQSESRCMRFSLSLFRTFLHCSPSAFIAFRSVSFIAFSLPLSLSPAPSSLPLSLSLCVRFSSFFFQGPLRIIAWPNRPNDRRSSIGLYRMPPICWSMLSLKTNGLPSGGGSLSFCMYIRIGSFDVLTRSTGRRLYFSPLLQPVFPAFRDEYLSFPVAFCSRIPVFVCPAICELAYRTYGILYKCSYINV